MTEAFAASARQDGHAISEDAFLIRPGDPVIVALADGAGAAEQAARRVLRQFDTLVGAASAGDVQSFPVWSRWLRTLDLGLSGGAVQSTFVAAAIVGERVVGAAAGDSRAYLWSREGDLRLLTEGASKWRLGSGRVTPFPIHAPISRGDIVLLLSDGAWAPLSMDRLRQAVARVVLRSLAEVPEEIIRDAGRTGAADDMTVVVARQSGVSGATSAQGAA